MSGLRISRRGLLSTGVAAGSSLALGADKAEAKSYSHEVPWAPGTADLPDGAAPGPLQFFTSEEAMFVDAAVARIIPADELGPGAKEAGVTVFLDRQLAGAYGRADTWYMRGPWKDGEKTQGYQSRLTPAQLYRAAIKGINAHCRKQYADKAFSDLTGAQQDEVLTGLEKGKIKLADLGPHPIEIEGGKEDTFFAQFLQNVIEGFFSDPIYGGNKDMAGWKLIGFPGAHYDYRAYVSKHGAKLDIPPVGIKGRPGWNPQT